LSPAVISMIELNREKRRAKVLVASDQLSLAIGKRGQNVRLASKLVGWEIDVRSKESLEQSIKKLLTLKSVGKKVAETLVDAGFGNIENLAKVAPEVLSGLKGIGKKKAISIIEETHKLLDSHQVLENKKENENKGEES